MKGVARDTEIIKNINRTKIVYNGDLKKERQDRDELEKKMKIAKYNEEVY